MEWLCQEQLDHMRRSLAVPGSAMRRDPSDQGTKVKRFLLYPYKNNTSPQQNFKMGGCSTLANNVVPKFG